MGKRNLYLETIPAEEAIGKYLEALEGLIEPDSEVIPVTESLDRITTEAIYARYSSPLFNASAMDGIAVIASHTEGAAQTGPKVLTEGEDFLPVDTGDPVHAPYDAVIMAEDVVELAPEDQGKLAPGDSDEQAAGDAPLRVSITQAAHPWQHIRPVGEDIVAGEMILPGRHRIRAIDVGVLLSAGITQVRVIRRPRVAIFPTGDEIVEAEDLAKAEAEDLAKAEAEDLAKAGAENLADPGAENLADPGAEAARMIEAGAIIESNSRMFENLVTEGGGIGCRYPVLPDDYKTIRDRIRDAVRTHDMVIVNAGSSAGRDDYTVHVLRELGEVIVHGVAIKPGKPVILAIVEGRPVIGLPGYPVSAYIGFDLFVQPLLEKMTGRRSRRENTVEAVISRRLVSSLKHREYVRVKVGRVGDRLVASPLARGAGAAMSLVRADGFCVIPRSSEGVEAGDRVEVQLYRPLDEIEGTAVIIGSHDLILDVIADLMSERYPESFVTSTHVGSMGGLMALKRGECHIAPTHLMDETTGIYNIPILERQFREGVTLVKGVSRIQGIMVKKGNPLGIRGIEDLARPIGDLARPIGDQAKPSEDLARPIGESSEGAGAKPSVRFINRQRGAGTRVLFDYRLKQLGIEPGQIDGYDREATTHMAVAAAVAGDSCDAGMGVLSAARAMDLEFIPVAEEEYDFAIPTKYMELPPVQAFLEILTGEEFRERAEKLGGYTFPRTGEQYEIARRD